MPTNAYYCDSPHDFTSLDRTQDISPSSQRPAPSSQLPAPCFQGGMEDENADPMVKAEEGMDPEGMSLAEPTADEVTCPLQVYKQSLITGSGYEITALICHVDVIAFLKLHAVTAWV